MSIRTKLFLWVGCLFFFAFLFSYFWEKTLTDKNVNEATDFLRQKIIGLSDERRKNVEEYLTSVLTERLASIDALLQRVADVKIFREDFAPTPTNAEKGTWSNATDYFLFNKELGFLQNTSDGALASLLVPRSSAMQGTTLAPIEEGMGWIVLNDNAYMGIRLSIAASPAEALAIGQIRDHDAYFLFSWHQVLEYQKLWTENCCEGEEENRAYLGLLSIKEYQAAVQKSLRTLQRAAAYLTQGFEKYAGKDPQKMQAWIAQEISQRRLQSPLPQKSSDCSGAIDEPFSVPFSQFLLRNDQILLAVSLSRLATTKPFGTHPFASAAPVGAAAFPSGEIQGYGFMSSDIFFNQLLFDDAAAFAAHPHDSHCTSLVNPGVVIAPPSLGTLFLGNILQLKQGDRVGYLTLGLNIDAPLRQLALSFHQEVCVVHQGSVVSAFSAKGEKLKVPEHLQQVDEMLAKPVGVVPFKGGRYFFIHMIPFPHLDFHFFMLRPEAQEFALLNTINDGSKAVINQISFDMRMSACIALVLVLVLLQRLSTKMTQPISLLAKATAEVREGRLHTVHLPELPSSSQDEIHTLYVSFAEMIKGLKEREQFKGVLNKVVSEEIASEILKGRVELGGEEKELTVMFADIRGFSSLTENMSPQEVIQMLNACMTKISHEIDHYGGVIDKYIGDEVMALFGAFLHKENSALAAVECAQAMLASLTVWNQERALKGLVPIEMGIGIHTGRVVVGNMGAENRLNYTVLGANVNLASRLCSAAKKMEILISTNTLEAPGVKEKVRVETMPTMTLKGFSAPIAVYRVC